MTEKSLRQTGDRNSISYGEEKREVDTMDLKSRGIVVPLDQLEERIKAVLDNEDSDMEE